MFKHLISMKSVKLFALLLLSGCLLQSNSLQADHLPKAAAEPQAELELAVDDTEESSEEMIDLSTDESQDIKEDEQEPMIDGSTADDEPMIDGSTADDESMIDGSTADDELMIDGSSADNEPMIDGSSADDDNSMSNQQTKDKLDNNQAIAETEISTAQILPPISPHSTASLAEYNKNAQFDFLYKYPAEMLDVKTLCPWRSKTDKGWLRVTRTREKASHKLYIQWIRSQQSSANNQSMMSDESSVEMGKSRDQLLATLSVDEINDYANFVFAMPQQKINSDACQLTLFLTNTKTKRRFKAKLFIKGPGKYECEMTGVIDE